MQQQTQPLPPSGLSMRQQPPPTPQPAVAAGLVRSDSTSSQVGREALSSGRDFLSSVSSELNGLAAQTSSLFGGLFGSKNSNRGQAASAGPQPFRLHTQSSGGSTDSNQRAKERQPPFGPFPRSKSNHLLDNFFLINLYQLKLANRRGLVEKSSLIKHTTSSKSKLGDGYGQQPSIEQRSANTIDSQTLLKDVIKPIEICRNTQKCN